MNVHIVNKRLPLAAQIPAGMFLQLRHGKAIAAPRILPGWSTKLNIVGGKR